MKINFLKNACWFVFFIMKYQGLYNQIIFTLLACLYINFNPLRSFNVRDLYTELSWILLWVNFKSFFSNW